MKRIITIVAMLLVSAAYVFGFNVYQNAQAEKKIYAADTDQESAAPQSDGPKTVNVYLKRVYLNGQTAVDVKPVTILSMEDFWARFSGWKLVDQNANKIVFQKKINDISPLLKASGYFGLSPNGILTIYEGSPHGDRAVHSFFQIDVKKLESRMQRELQKGIPINTTDHYRKVLKALKQYAVKKEQ